MRVPILPAFDWRQYSAPSWIERLTGPLLEWATSVTSAFSSRIRLVTNVEAQIITAEVITGSTVSDSFPLDYNLTMQHAPEIVLLAHCVDIAENLPVDALGVPSWENISKGVQRQVRITHVPGLQASSSYRLTFLCLPGQE